MSLVQVQGELDKERSERTGKCGPWLSRTGGFKSGCHLGTSLRYGPETQAWSGLEKMPWIEKLEEQWPSGQTHLTQVWWTFTSRTEAHRGAEKETSIWGECSLKIWSIDSNWVNDQEKEVERGRQGGRIFIFTKAHEPI